MGDACSRCLGHGRVPVTPGRYDAWRVCPTCNGSGGRLPYRRAVRSA